MFKRLARVCLSIILISFGVLSISIIIARTERLKEAKVEAEKIITSYKGELEAKYQAALAKVPKILSFLCLIIIFVLISWNIALF